MNNIVNKMNIGRDFFVLSFFQIENVLDMWHTEEMDDSDKESIYEKYNISKDDIRAYEDKVECQPFLGHFFSCVNF